MVSRVPCCTSDLFSSFEPQSMIVMTISSQDGFFVAEVPCEQPQLYAGQTSCCSLPAPCCSLPAPAPAPAALS